MKKTFLFIFLSLLCFRKAYSEDFFIMGNGEINLKGSGKLVYRSEKGYDEKALRKINQAYGGDYDHSLSRLSLRFLEVLSNIQAHFKGAPLVIRSGYRSPHENQGLRNQGKLAATSSMHIEAAAMDFYLEGVDTLELKNYAMSLPCCGVGYYHGKHIHLDTGPKRWWDEKTSGTEKKEPQENEKIIALSTQDIYPPPKNISFDLARVTDFPFGIPASLKIETLSQGEWKGFASAKFLPSDDMGKIPSNPCYKLSERMHLKGLAAIPDKSLLPGRYRIKIIFCEKPWAKMPSEIYSNEFEVRK